MQYWLFTIPAILNIYPTLWGLTLQSTNAALLGRYSYVQAAIIATHLSAQLMYFVSTKNKKWESTLLFISFGIFYALSIFARANQAFRQMFGIEHIWTFSRVFICAAIFSYSIKFIRDKKVLPANIFMITAISFCVLPILDLTVTIDRYISHSLPAHSEKNIQQKENIQKSKYIPEKSIINEGDFLIIGDSFVAGNGASEASKSFADLIDAKLNISFNGTRLHSLGKSGASPQDYLELLRIIPIQKKLNRIILTIYPNDLDFSPYNSPLRLFILYHLDGSSPGLQFIQTRLAAASWIADVNIYHQILVKNFDTNDISFNARWEKFQKQITEFYNLAQVRSQNRPLFVILPILENFSNYPLEKAHKRLATDAASIGYETIDTLDFFKKSNEDAVKLRALPNDNHFGNKGHEIVRDAILSKFLKSK